MKLHKRGQHPLLEPIPSQGIMLTLLRAYSIVLNYCELYVGF